MARNLNLGGDPELPLLWFIVMRWADGPQKFGCGHGLCGVCPSCDKQAVRACIHLCVRRRGREVPHRRPYPM